MEDDSLPKYQSPIRLTLPKPAMYPYSQTSILQPPQNINLESGLEQNWTTNVLLRTEQANALHRGAFLKLKVG